MLLVALLAGASGGAVASSDLVAAVSSSLNGITSATSAVSPTLHISLVGANKDGIKFEMPLDYTQLHPITLSAEWLPGAKASALAQANRDAKGYKGEYSIFNNGYPVMIGVPVFESQTLPVSMSHELFLGSLRPGNYEVFYFVHSNAGAINSGGKGYLYEARLTFPLIITEPKWCTLKG